MSSFKVFVLGDGADEVGHDWKNMLGPDKLPALPRLVHRILGEPSGVEYQCGRFCFIHHGRGKGDTAAKKVIAAVTIARLKEFHAVVVLVDRDRAKPAEKLGPLVAGQKRAGETGGPPCAVGAAVETFDAWMIADADAVDRADGDHEHCARHPEKLAGKEYTGQHPKDVAEQILGSREGLGAKYAIIAAHVDMVQLCRTCPEGFAPFHREVTDRIGPVVDAGRA